MFGEMRDSSHHGRPQNDPTDNFGNDSRLTNPFKQPAEPLCEANDDEELDAEEGNGLE